VGRRLAQHRDGADAVVGEQIPEECLAGDDRGWAPPRPAPGDAGKSRRERGCRAARMGCDSRRSGKRMDCRPDRGCTRAPCPPGEQQRVLEVAGSATPSDAGPCRGRDGPDHDQIDGCNLVGRDGDDRSWQRARCWLPATRLVRGARPPGSISMKQRSANRPGTAGKRSCPVERGATDAEKRRTGFGA